MIEGPHRFPVRVYYEDTDFSGVVYHANYLRFLERGRTETLRSAAISQADLRDGETGQSMAFAVRHMDIDFLRAARMDDLLEVETALGEIGGASITMVQRLLRGDEVLIRATVKIALVMNGRARRLPALLIEPLRAMSKDS